MLAGVVDGTGALRSRSVVDASLRSQVGLNGRFGWNQPNALLVSPVITRVGVMQACVFADVLKYVVTLTQCTAANLRLIKGDWSWCRPNAAKRSSTG